MLAGGLLEYTISFDSDGTVSLWEYSIGISRVKPTANKVATGKALPFRCPFAALSLPFHSPFTAYSLRQQGPLRCSNSRSHFAANERWLPPTSAGPPQERRSSSSGTTTTPGRPGRRAMRSTSRRTIRRTSSRPARCIRPRRRRNHARRHARLCDTASALCFLRPFAAKALPSHYVSTAFTAKALPSPCVSTACAAKAQSSPCFPLPAQLRHCRCLVRSMQGSFSWVQHNNSQCTGHCLPERSAGPGGGNCDRLPG